MRKVSPLWVTSIARAEVTDAVAAGEPLNRVCVFVGVVVIAQNSLIHFLYAHTYCKIYRGDAADFHNALTRGTSHYFDALLPQASTPPTVLRVNKPHLGNYSCSTSFPNGSGAAAYVFNALVNEVADKFPNIIVADTQTAGYWTTTEALPGVGGALEQTNGVHSSELNDEALFRTARDAWLTSTMRNTVQIRAIGTASRGTVEVDAPSVPHGSER